MGRGTRGLLLSWSYQNSSRRHLNMEVFVAKRDYEKEREDYLSFKEGDKFQVASKADKKLWAVYAENGDYGYVPSDYLEV